MSVTITSSAFTGTNGFTLTWSSTLSVISGYFQIMYFTQGFSTQSGISQSIPLTQTTATVTDPNGIQSGLPCAVQLYAFNPDGSILAVATPIPYVIGGSFGSPESITIKIAGWQPTGNSLSVVWESTVTGPTTMYYVVTAVNPVNPAFSATSPHIEPFDNNYTFTNTITINHNLSYNVIVSVYTVDGTLITATAPYLVQGVLRPPVGDGNNQSVPCFPAGTRIAVPGGTVLVEDLKTGDLVQTADGRSVVARVYVRTLERTTKNTAPYTIPKGYRGLKETICLSPLHAFQVAKDLWQSPKFAAEQSDTVEQYGIGLPMVYYHVECPNFFTDNLLVNGCVVESYGLNQAKDTLYVYNQSLKGFTRQQTVVTKIDKSVRL